MPLGDSGQRRRKVCHWVTPGRGGEKYATGGLRAKEEKSMPLGDSGQRRRKVCHWVTQSRGGEKEALAKQASRREASLNTPFRGFKIMVAYVASSQNAENSLKEEIADLEELHHALCQQAVALDETWARERIKFSKTFKGQIFNKIGYLLLLYCGLKMFLATVNIIFDRVGNVDTITKALDVAVTYFGLQFDVKYWAQVLAFFMVSIMIICSIRSFLINLSKIFHTVASKRFANIVVLCLTQAMGMYFMSSALLMRMNLPAEYRKMITDVFGDLQFNFYHRWLDVTFLLSTYCHP
ncbi:hypothetical protein ACOMHN_062635 [Nucella lapillus]